MQQAQSIKRPIEESQPRNERGGVGQTADPKRNLEGGKPRLRYEKTAAGATELGGALRGREEHKEE